MPCNGDKTVIFQFPLRIRDKPKTAEGEDKENSKNHKLNLLGNTEINL